MGFLKLQIIAALLGPVPQGKHNMVSRVRADVYSVPGIGEFYTRGCGFTAPRVTVDIGPEWVRFYGHDGEWEGDCKRALYPPTRVPTARVPIPRGIATVYMEDRK